MRRILFIFLPTLLFISAGLRAEEPGFPTPPDGKCVVAADKHWTKQEKFIWARVCAGLAADFNAAPGYGGYIDPRTPAMQDKHASRRIVRSSFLETILLRAKYRRALTRYGVSIVGARFVQPVDLQNAELAHSLEFSGCLFEQGAYLNGLRSSRGISFVGSKVIGPLHMGTLRATDLFMTDNAEFDDVFLRDAQINGSIDLIGAKVTGTLDMIRIRLSAGLFMRDNAELADIALDSARVATLDLHGSKVTGKLDLTAIHVEGDLNMGDHAKFAQVVFDGADLGANVNLSASEFSSVSLRGARVTGNLDISGSNVTDTLDMSRIKIGADLRMDNMAKFNEVVILSAKVADSIVISNSEVTGKLNMDGIQVGDSIFVSDGSKFNDVVLTYASVGKIIDLRQMTAVSLDFGYIRAGALTMYRSTVMDAVNFDGARVQSDLDIRNDIMFGGISLRNAHIDGNVYLTGTKVTENLNMDDMHVGANLNMSDQAEFTDVSMRGANVGGDIDISASTVTGTLGMSPSQIGARLFMNNGAKFNDVILRGARVANIVNLSSSEVTGGLAMDDIQVGSTLFMRDGAKFANVFLGNAKIGKNIDLSGAILDGGIDCFDLEVGQDVLLVSTKSTGAIDLRLARIKGNLDLSGGELHGTIDLTAAQIGGGLELGPQQPPAGQPVDTFLILRNAKADIIPNLTDAWPSKLDLDGFTYRSVGDAKNFNPWFAKLDHYAAQPYTQLAGIVQARGNNELATSIRFTGRDNERKSLDGWPLVWLTILWGSIGYGYYLYVALIWVVAFVFVGTMTLRNSEQSWRNGLWSWSDKILFSIDNLLPIIRLREKNYKVDLEGGVAWYFYLHKVMGYVLASFLIAGLSGLTK